MCCASFWLCWNSDKNGQYSIVEVEGNKKQLFEANVENEELRIQVDDTVHSLLLYCYQPIYSKNPEEKRLQGERNSAQKSRTAFNNMYVSLDSVIQFVSFTQSISCMILPQLKYTANSSNFPSICWVQ